MAGLAVEPGSENKCKCQLKVDSLLANLLTSSADWAMKKPTVLGAILKSLGFIQILLSLPSSPSPVPFSSMASSSSFSLTKHTLAILCQTSMWGIRYTDAYSAARANVLEVKEGDKVSVYISHPVPWR